MSQNMLALLNAEGEVVDWVETSMTMEEAIDLDRMLREQGILTGEQEVIFTKREDKVNESNKNYNVSSRLSFNKALTIARKEFPENADKIQEFIERTYLSHEDYGLDEKGRKRLEELREDKDILEFLDFIQK